MFGITAGTIAAAGSLASAGAGIAGAASGGGAGAQMSKEDKMWNDYLRLQQMGLMNKQNGLLKDAKGVYKNPNAWNPYTGERVAGFNPDQTTAFGMVRDAAAGNPYMTGAGNATMDVLNGKYLDHQAGTNSYLGSTVGTNPLLGVNNPYLNSQISQAQGDISRQYNQTIAPQTDASFARAGAFGGSAWGQQNAENNRQLANELGRVDSNMRMADYTNQQNLYESGLNRSQADLARNSALAQDAIGLNENAWQSERGRMMNGINAGLSMNDQLFKNAGYLGAAGDKEQSQAQRMDDAAYQAYLDKQNSYRAPIDWMQGMLNKANSTYGNPTAQSPVGMYSNPYAMGMGIGNTVAGLAGNKDFTGLFSSSPSAGSSGGGFSNASVLGNGSSGWVNPFGK